MRWLIAFEKNAELRYVSHLDLLRAMQRLFRRAGFPVAFSAGFHPHPIFSFAMALPVGVTSAAEYLDVETREVMTGEGVLSCINAAAPKGLVFTGAWVLPAEAPGLMALVEAALWQITFDRDMAPAVAQVLEASALPMERKKDGKASVVDIRPGIRRLTAQGNRVEALLDAGSRGNVPPQLLADALLGESALGRTDIRRLRLLTNCGGALLPLENKFEDRE